MKKDTEEDVFILEYEVTTHNEGVDRLIEEKLARLITRSNIGVNAEVLTDDTGKVALSIRSDETGVRGNRDTSFDISDNNTHKTSGTVEYFVFHRATGIRL